MKSSEPYKKKSYGILLKKYKESRERECVCEGARETESTIHGNISGT